MPTKSNRKSSNTSKPVYSELTKEFARHEAHAASRLLWTKILSEATPKVREMLLAHTHLQIAVCKIVPEEYETNIHIEHSLLYEYVEKAEELLTGMTPDLHAEVFNHPIVCSQTKNDGASGPNFSQSKTE